MKMLEVLIVEDNIKISRTHQAFVEKVEGFQVTGIANTIADARIMLDTLEPDLILLDIYFPESNGLDFLKELRAAHTTDVILITAAREVGMLHQALQGGAFDYMIKPVFYERFNEALCNYRRYRGQLDSDQALTQEEADRLFRSSSSGGIPGIEDLPKGIDMVTLNTVVQVFEKDQGACLSATEVGERIGTSRTTARKYLEYLISTGSLQINLDYGTKGRPERKYHLDRDRRR
jgi:two-component system, CitB family, response regulator